METGGNSFVNIFLHDVGKRLEIIGGGGNHFSKGWAVGRVGAPVATSVIIHLIVTVKHIDLAHTDEVSVATLQFIAIVNFLHAGKGVYPDFYDLFLTIDIEVDLIKIFL